jgi:hypothetical protein
MPFLHGVRHTVIRDTGRTILYKEPEKSGRSKRGVRGKQNATMAEPRPKGAIMSGKQGNVNKTSMETLELEIAHRIAQSSVWIRKISVRTLLRGLPPPTQNKRPLSAD